MTLANWIPYSPGTVTEHNPTSKYGPNGYPPREAALWDAYADVFYALMYGFDDTRQPDPGEAIDPERYEAWRKKVLDAMSAGLWSSPMPAERPQSIEEMMPEDLWQYFYQRCLAAIQ